MGLGIKIDWRCETKHAKFAMPVDSENGIMNFCTPEDVVRLYWLKDGVKVL